MLDMSCSVLSASVKKTKLEFNSVSFFFFITVHTHTFRLLIVVQNRWKILQLKGSKNFSNLYIPP